MNVTTFNTEREQSIFLTLMENTCAAIKDMYGGIIPIIDPETKINFRSKDNGEWGYYANSRVGEIALLMRKYKLFSIVDLGSGAGLILLILKHLGYVTKGIEIEESLVSISRKIGIQTQQKDILKLTNTDIAGKDCIYFWEPLKDEELCQKFIDNLSKVVQKGQYIIYDCAGYTKECLLRNEKFQFLEVNNGIYVFRVIT